MRKKEVVEDIGVSYKNYEKNNNALCPFRCHDPIYISSCIYIIWVSSRENEPSL